MKQSVAGEDGWGGCVGEWCHVRERDKIVVGVCECGELELEWFVRLASVAPTQRCHCSPSTVAYRRLYGCTFRNLPALDR